MGCQCCCSDQPKDKEKCCCYSGIGVGAFGIFAILFGIFFSRFILQQFQHELHHSLRLQTPEEDQTLYNHWANDNYDGASPEHWSYWMFNVTNADDVILNGAAPIVNEHGPYVYREFHLRYNVTFADDNNLITYNEQSIYAFDKALSCSTCNENDQIVSLYPTYITLIKEAGDQLSSEALLMSPFVNLTLVSLSRVAKATNACSSDVECNQMAMNHFITAAGIPGVVPPQTSVTQAKDFKAKLPDLGLEIFAQILDLLPIPPEISLSVANVKVSEDFIQHGAYAWAFNYSSSSSSSSGFSCAMGSQKSPDPDMGCITFFLDSFLLQTLDKTFPAISASDAGNLTTHFITLGSSLLPALCDLAGALHPNQGACGYRKGTTKSWLFQLDDPFLRFQDAAASGGQDPGFGSSIANTAFFANSNASNVAASWKENQFFTTTQTGKKDINKIDAEVGYESNFRILPQYEDSNTTGYFCAGPSRIWGSAVEQPFGPGSAGWFDWVESFTKEDHAKVWVDEMLRPVTLKYRETYRYRGIQVFRYEIADNEFSVMPQFDIHIPGVLNMTCPNHGTPIQLTLPHYAKAQIPPSLRVQGVTAVIPDEHYSFLDIDPITGSTLIGHERLQINLMLQPEWVLAQGVSPSSSFNTSKIHPALWVEDSAHMSDQNEHDYKSQVWFVLNLHRAILISFLTVGSVAVVTSCIILAIGCYYKRKMKDSEANGDRINYQKLDASVNDDSK